MKYILALILGICLCASPASAVVITQIAGTGAGGNITNVTFSATSSVALVTTAAIPARSLVVVIANNCHAGTVTSFSVSDTHSNSYTAPRAIDQASDAAVQIFRSFTANTINSGDTITLSMSGTNGCLTGQVLAFNGAATSPDDVSTGTNGTGASGTLTVGPTSAYACPGAVAGCEVLIGSVVIHTTRTTANDGNYVSTVTTGAGQNWISGFWIVGATTAQSYVPSISGGTSDWAGQLVSFKALSTPTCNLLTTGVGGC